MILQRLCQLYERMEKARGTSAEDTQLAPYGYAVAKVSFVLVLKRDGTLVNVEDARREIAVEPDSKRPAVQVSTPLIVPAIPGRTVAVSPGFLCDNSQYMLGLAPAAKPGTKKADPKRVLACFEAFRDRHLHARTHVKDGGFQAVCKFLESWSPKEAAEFPLLLELAGGYGVFQLRGADHYVHETAPCRTYWDSLQSEPDTDEISVIAPSLISGRVQRLARLHEPPIKGVVGAQTSGAKLASFNCASFESYGKSQTYNAPVGVEDAFRYCTALNHLLADPRRRVRLGDTTVVFWTENPKAQAVQDVFAAVISTGEAEDQGLMQRLGAWARAAQQGRASDLGNPASRFFVLGLAPNASRLSVRFWIEQPVGELITNLNSHAEALALADAPDGYSLPTLRQIAGETVPAKRGWPDEDKIPPRLVGEIGRAVLLGLPYPASLLAGVVGRARAEGWVNPDKRLDTRRVAHRRAGVIAACLRRNPRSPVEVPMSLNESHPAPAYQVGRLFAVLDVIAEDVSDRRVNRRDKYFTAASATPALILPRLLRLSMHDLKKFETDKKHYRVAREKSIQSIMDRIDAFPTQLTLEQQGLFCLGYYQQRQSIFSGGRTAEAAAEVSRTTA